MEELDSGAMKRATFITERKFWSSFSQSYFKVKNTNF